MGQLYVTTQPHKFSFNIIGPPTATSVAPSQPITVAFDDGSSVTVPQDTPAILPSGGTTWDRTSAVYVLYVLKGDGTLRAQRESQLANISGDYAPIARTLYDSTIVYEPQQPGGTAVASGAWSGGAFISSARSVRGGGSYGAFDTKSVQGGGSVSGIGLNIPSSAGNAANTTVTVVSGFLKVSAAPGGDTTVFDLSAGAPGYLRLKLTSALHLVAESVLSGMPNAGSVDLGAISTNTWNWWSVGYVTPSGGVLYLTAAITPAGQPQGGAQNSGNMWTGSGNSSPINLTAVFGLGITQSSSYANAPSSGWQFSKIVIDQPTLGGTANELRAPLSADLGTHATAGEYMCQQPVGSVSSLTDTGTNGANLAAGAPGLVIVADGPYA